MSLFPQIPEHVREKLKKCKNSISDFTFAMPIIRCGWPVGADYKYDEGYEVDISTYDFEPVAKEIMSAKNMEEVYQLLKKYKCNRPGIVQILFDVGIMKVNENGFYSPSLNSIMASSSMAAALPNNIQFKYKVVDFLLDVAPLPKPKYLNKFKYDK